MRSGGSGRLTTTRAVSGEWVYSLYADFFPQDSEAAFANIVLAGGTASAVAFFVFPIPELTRMWRASAALVSALIALGAHVGAEAMHRAEKRRMIQ